MGKISQLCWKFFTWLEVIRTTAKKDCSETIGKCCCFTEWRCVRDITSHDQHSTLQNLCSLNASESCSCSPCVHGVLGCSFFIFPDAEMCMHVDMIIGIITYMHYINIHIYIYIYRQGMFISISYIMIVHVLI